jgi:HAD superfamily 5'-nucleotidase-like hydrolase
LNLRAIRAIGYDMDYTLIHYRIEEWERRAYEHLRQKLLGFGWPVKDLQFDPVLIVRGLIVDTEHGNLLKANRFGYVKRAFHGTRRMDFDEQRAMYSRALVDLNERRFQFLNTLFSLSEACMYAQLVDLLDAGEVEGVVGYADLYRAVRTSIDEAHMEGELKAEIIADPDRFVELDPDLPLALLDQRYAGKKLLLITNSEWDYTRAMMSYALDSHLPASLRWRDLFDVIIVSAGKPSFFWSLNPVFEVVNDEGMLRPAPRGIRSNGIYLGGTASMVEAYLGVDGDEILYVGDHLYTDVHVSKSVSRWRTALVLRELEADFAAASRFEADQHRLTSLMRRKERLEFEMYQLRLQLQRKRERYGPAPKSSIGMLERRLSAIREEIGGLDAEISPLASAASELSNPNWGPLMRAGNDKSHLARQVERHADVYMSRVSNLVFQTPFGYLRSPRGSLPHDPEPGAGAVEEEQG